MLLTNFANVAARDALEQEMTWENRDIPVSVFGMLSRTADKHGQGNAISYQILSGTD